MTEVVYQSLMLFYKNMLENTRLGNDLCVCVCVCDAHVVFYIIFSPINRKNMTYCSTHFLQELSPGLSDIEICPI